ncbi:HNH endonuclease signature motif containing protein [Microbacterium sp. 3J1]|uniref:HNH endonuclease signature motif containing protein n=1 Tax=Microbacterium sp. 3J1 TaxID=861269 RepID=UPI000B88651B|nr:HNH endonuclease signature motif containing protein [Microbacterium sp. 3J1]
MNSTAELLDRVVADLDAVLSDDALASLSDADRITVLKTAGAAFRRVEAVVVETIATADIGDFPHAAGCRGMNELLQRTLSVEARAATLVDRVVDRVRRPVSLAGERLPARWHEMRLALLDGAVGVSGFLAATTPIEKVWERISVDQRLAADVALAGAARGHGLVLDDRSDLEGGEEGSGPSPTAQDLKSLAEDLASMFDPDGEEPKDEDARRRRGITIGRLKDGVHAIRGYLTSEVAAQLQLIMDALLNPKADRPAVPGVRFAPSGDDARGDDPFNSDPRCVIDDRTAAQKRHDALAAVLGIAARHKDMPTLGGSSPVLVVNVDAKDVATHTSREAVRRSDTSGWATIPGSGAHVPVSVATQIACTGAIQRVLFDEGRIIAITTTDRVFTVHQRRAIIARDEECLIPGCHVPASWCEIHHVTEHARGGPTHTDNGVPLCWWHHRSLGTSGWEIRMNDGRPQVRGPRWWDPEQRWRTPRHSLRGAAADRSASTRLGGRISLTGAHDRSTTDTWAQTSQASAASSSAARIRRRARPGTGSISASVPGMTGCGDRKRA